LAPLLATPGEIAAIAAAMVLVKRWCVGLARRG